MVCLLTMDVGMSWDIEVGGDSVVSRNLKRFTGRRVREDDEQEVEENKAGEK